MKKFSTITTVAITSSLLMGCHSKQYICAEFFSEPNPGSVDSVEHIADYWGRLNIKTEVPDNYSDGRDGIENFCEKYKT